MEFPDIQREIHRDDPANAILKCQRRTECWTRTQEPGVPRDQSCIVAVLPTLYALAFVSWRSSMTSPLPLNTRAGWRTPLPLLYFPHLMHLECPDRTYYKYSTYSVLIFTVLVRLTPRWDRTVTRGPPVAETRCLLRRLPSSNQTSPQ
jgi:hypothetical protein